MRTAAAKEASADTSAPLGGEAEQSWLKKLGPGLITGAADDDPSGIATYSQAGAQFGFGMLWTILFTYPLMVGIQIINAKIGSVSGHGLATNIRKHYPRWILYAIISLLLVANIINIAADVAAMGAALKLLVDGPAHLFALGFGLLSVVLQVFVPYHRYVRILKWLTVLRNTMMPTIRWSPAYITTMVAVFGTFFIILTTAVTLHAHGITQIDTPAQAASALKPIAGEFAFVLFSVGIIGTGLLAIPVLAGSAAYAISGAFQWPNSLSAQSAMAKKFYAIIVLATLMGVALCFSKVDPIKALYWSAVINGVISVPIMVAMMLMAARADIMGKLVISRRLSVLGWLCTAAMGAAVLAMLYTMLG